MLDWPADLPIAERHSNTRLSLVRRRAGDDPLPHASAAPHRSRAGRPRRWLIERQCNAQLDLLIDTVRMPG